MTNMKRALSLLLVVLMTLSLLPLASFAADGAGSGTTATVSEIPGLVMTKSYDAEKGELTLEAYATGSSTTTVTTKPVDIVLVLDQSGSMADDFDGNSTSTNSSRRQYAMKNAVNAFIAEIGSKYSNEGDHRVAIVTFGINDNVLQGWTFVDAAGQMTLTNSINGLPNSPSGSTNVGAGMQRAENLMGSGYSYTGANTDRAKAVVVFTDGVPTTGSDFDTGVADTAIASAKRMKDSGVSIYSVGIFNGANPDELYGASGFDRNSDGSIGSDWSDFSFWKIGDILAYDIPAGNRFLNYLSSNFSDASAIGIENFRRTFFGVGYRGWKITQNFERTDTKYYMTASNADDLKNVFTSISQSIGGADITLTSSTEMRDVISEYFDLPENAADQIRVYTQKLLSLDKDASGRYTTWGERVDVTSVYPQVVDRVTKTVTVSGFSYSDNWVGPHDGVADGLKLVLVIPIVDNGKGTGSVPTNGEGSGLYVDNELVNQFGSPEAYFPFYTIHHVQGGKDVAQTQHRIGPNENLCARVTDGFLYGGAFTDPDCKIPAFSNGKALDFAPTDKAEYYIWEVPNHYLKPANYNVWRHVNGEKQVVRLYMMTALDRLEYAQVGFNVKIGNGVGADVPCQTGDADVAYGLININQNNQLKRQVYLKDGYFKEAVTAEEGHDPGYIGCVKLADFDGFAQTGMTFQPYWITLDGVRVTNQWARTCYHRGAGYEQPVVENVDVGASCTKSVSGQSMLSYCAVYTVGDADPVDPVDPVDPIDPVDPPVEEGIKVTVVDNGTVYEVPVEAGDITGQISYAGAESMLFAGWYTDELYTSPADFTNVQQSMTVYARYVSDAYLQVAYKKLEGWFGVSSLTLISAIDGRNYRETGFIVNGQTMVVSEYTGGSRPGFGFGGWSGFGFGGFGSRESASDYFDGVAADALLMKQMVPVWNLSEGDTLEITPYWVTMDGTTVIGTSRTLTYTGRSITG